MRLLIAGGGTGGHVFPGLAIAHKLKKTIPSSKILFVGTKRGLESRLIPQNGFEIAFIKIRGLKRSSFKNKLLSFFEIPYSIFRSMVIILRFKPDYVLGVGGYASGPTLLAAILLFRKSAIMEQNSIPGITNRILAKFVKKIFISYDLNLKYFAQKKTIFTGNPVSPFFLEQISSTKIDNKHSPVPVLTILGGSQGARKINQTVLKMLTLLGPDPKIEVIHQCGKSDYEELQEEYKNFSFKFTLKPFFDNISEIYLKSDLIICRAGAMTISEIQIAGKPSILIPLKTAADNHQELNASHLVENKAAVLIKEDDLTPQLLLETVQNLILNPKTLEEMASNAKRMALPHAASRILSALNNQE